MSGATPTTRRVLLVEDNPGDAELVSEMLAHAGPDDYHIVHVARLSDAVEKLQSIEADVVLLDLRLPDASGVEGVKAIRKTTGQIPIVVLTGKEDEELALACLDAGAQDYLAKSDARSQNLRRVIGYAITRQREAQVRELQSTLERYRALSSQTQVTAVTAALAGSGAICTRSPASFENIVSAYFNLLEPYLSRRTARLEAPQLTMEHVATMIGDANGGPRDLLDVHVAALDRAIAECGDAHSLAIVFEARLLALQMMACWLITTEWGIGDDLWEERHDKVQTSTVHHRTDATIAARPGEFAQHLRRRTEGCVRS